MSFRLSIGTGGLTLLAALLLPPAPVAQAQETGAVRGTVTGRQGQPMPATTISITGLGPGDARHERTTDADGQFQLEGLAPGQYSVAADNPEVGGQIFRVLVQPGGTVEVRFVLERGATAAPWLRGLRDDQASVSAFEAGVRASRAGDHAEAIVQFEAALRLLPSCVDCHFNIGVAYGQLERYADAEAAFKSALRLQPDYAAAYYGLADIFSRQGLTDEAAVARDAATQIAINALAAGQARALEDMTRGRAFLDSGNVEEAVAELAAAVAADSTLTEAQYWLGRALQERGDADAAFRSLRRYVAGAPNGEYAADARRRLDELRQ